MYIFKRILCTAAILPLLAAATAQTIRDKTMVAWVQPFNLDQKGGSVLTLDNYDHFDAIVFGELSPARWMAGSEGFARTKSDQIWPPETMNGNEWVRVAVIYKGDQITIMRNNEIFVQYTSQSPMAEFDLNSIVLFGKRHIAQGDNSHFAGAIDEARIYDTALTPKEVGKLRPGKVGGKQPWAWWDFENDPQEKTGRLTNVTLTPGAMVFNGALILDGISGEMYASAREIKGKATGSDSFHVPGEVINTVHDFRQRLLNDPYRPTYHFNALEGYAMPFDPNGCIWWNGRYHMFYIYQDRGVHVFGHASSTDLAHWRHHPKALYPTPDSPEDGIFSGNAFLTKEGEAAMLYHGTGAGNTIALSADENLEFWRKMPGNPIIPNPGEGVTSAAVDPVTGEAPYASWDPHGWLEGDTYYAIFGGARAAIFRAKELDKWEYVGDVLSGTVGDIPLREDISCPDLFKLGDKYVLLCISHRLGCRYYIGEWRDEQFHPESHAMMSWSDNAYFAPESLLAPDGRRIMWAWVFDGRDGDTQRRNGWSGTMSLPRELFMREDHTLGMRPVAELRNQRYNGKTFGDMTVRDNSEKILEGARGNVIEVTAEIDPTNASRSGIAVCRSDDGSEQTRIYYDAEQKKLVLDATRSTVGTMGPRNIEAAPFELAPGETLSLDIFVDKSIIEVYANERQAVVRMVYPEKEDSKGVSLISEGGNTGFKDVTVWQMMPTNEY